MSATALVPHISEVDPNSDRFRAALRKARLLLAGTGQGVFSRHKHHDLEDDEIVFEQRVSDTELRLDTKHEHEVVGPGLPSCWGVNADGSTFVLRYADAALHAKAKAAGVDVTSEHFQTLLASVAADFAGHGLHTLLELTIAEYFLEVGPGQIAMETTDEERRTQRVTVIGLDEAAALSQGGQLRPAHWVFTGGVIKPRAICNAGGVATAC